MKNIIFLTSILIIFFISGCSDSVNNNKISGNVPVDNNYSILNLYNDQCVPGGFSDEEVSYYLSNGYFLDTLDNTALFTVDFIGDGGPYKSTGYVQAGTVMLINPFEAKGSGYFKLCGNHWLEEED